LFCSNLNGKFEIFRQGLKDSVGEMIVAGTGEEYRARLSPDGAWILYWESARGAGLWRPGATTLRAPARLMRVPVSGGPPEMILEEPASGEHYLECPSVGGSYCVLVQREGKDLIFYSLDPVRSKGPQLGKIEVADDFNGFYYQVSPDGSSLAFVDPYDDRYKGRIEVLKFSSGAWQVATVEPGWGELQMSAWRADGKGFYVTSRLPDSFNLLHVTPVGKVHLMLRNPQTQWFGGPMPSPDGKHLAFRAVTWDSNVWMLENF
jgi:WD40 repeat protein